MLFVEKVKSQPSCYITESYSEMEDLLTTHFCALHLIWNESVGGYEVHFDLSEYIRVQTGFHH